LHIELINSYIVRIEGIKKELYMDKEIEPSQLFELDERVEHLTDAQEQIIKKILAKVDKGIENGDKVVSHTEMVGVDDFDSTKEAMLTLKNVYSSFDVFPSSVGFIHKQSVEGVVEQGLYIDINLQPDETEIAE